MIDTLYKIKILKPFKPLLDAMDAAMFGTDETAERAPHLIDTIDIKRFMTMVIFALMPAAAAAVYFYGIYALYMILVSYAAGAVVEVAFAMIRKHPIEEGFLVTGLIFPLVLPPTLPLWVVAVGMIFGTLFGKEVFGGTGRNIFNPALVGRLFITIAFPKLMTTFVDPVNAVTTATPLVLYKTAQTLTPYMQLLIGNEIGGSLGETFRIGIMAGGIFLLCTKVGNWRIPFSYLGSVALFSLIGNEFISVKIAPPLFQLLTGGLLYGAFFMATDPVTSPYTRPGKYIFGIFAGLITVLIRAYAGYVEGVMFSIVLMNSFTPLIDHMVISVRYGGKKK
jgi:Na+-transporting NADH:ubiquinone oxidoreductase subunit B/electron transport complex protein RnfD